MDLFGIKKLKNQISEMTSQLQEKENTIVQQNIELSKLRTQLSLVKKDFNKYSEIYKLEQSLVDLNFEKSQSIWTEWPIEMHNSQPQLERQERACNPYYSPLSLSPDRGSAIFLGNYGKYNTTLLKCDCEDYKRRLLPCKHMYRLAYELDVFMLDDVQTVPDPSALMSLADAQKAIKKLSADNLEAFLDIIQKDSIIVGSQDPRAKLLSTGLVEKGSDYYALLDYFKRDILYSLLPADNTTKISKNLKKADLINLIISNYPQVLSETEKFYVQLVLKYELNFIKPKLLYFISTNV